MLVLELQLLSIFLGIRDLLREVYVANIVSV
jgi:hypothetical protein